MEKSRINGGTIGLQSGRLQVRTYRAHPSLKDYATDIKILDIYKMVAYETLPKKQTL